MRKDNESENIYWANYYKKNRITITYDKYTINITRWRN